VAIQLPPQQALALPQQLSTTTIPPITTTTTSTTTTTTCPPNGTPTGDTFCSGNDLYKVYHNGSCGTYSTLFESNSPSCLPPPTTTTTTCLANGTLISSYCNGNDLRGTYANGSCGTYDALIESNSESCLPPPTTTTTTSTTLAPQTYNYYFLKKCSEAIDRVARTTATLFDSQDSQAADAVSIFGTCYFVNNTATKNHTIQTLEMKIV